MSEEMQEDGVGQYDGQSGVGENADNQIAVDDDEGEDDRKVFVGGLSWETTTKELRDYFEKYGEVTNCTLKTDLETRKSRGFAFVVFASKEGVDKVLAEKEHKLHGRTIDCKQANPRPINKKVFVGRLDITVTEDEVRSYFETFGPVDKIELPFDKTKEQRRAFCFVEFKKQSSMKACLEQTSHKIGTHEVEVRKATPQGASNARGGYGRGRGFSSPGRGGRGGRGSYHPSYAYNQGYYPSYGYDQSYGYSGYGSDYYGAGYAPYSSGYDQNYGYSDYDDYGYAQGGDY